MTSGRWTEEDVIRHQSRLRSRRPLPESPSPPPIAPGAIVRVPARSKYQAVPCIVTTNGTLFPKPDIEQAEAAAGTPLAGTGSLVMRASRVGIFGRWFGSLKEGRRYVDLMQLEKAAQISELELQVPFELSVTRPDGEIVRLGEYRADFTYRDMQAARVVVEKIVEDTKGMRTPLYRWKKAHFEAQYGLTILEG